MDLPSSSIACVNDKSVRVNVAELNEFLDRADSGWAVVMFACDFPPTNPCRVVHASALSTRFVDQLKQDRAARLKQPKPNPPVVRTKSAEDGAVLPFAKKPKMSGHFPPSIICQKKMATVSEMAESKVSVRPAISTDCRCDCIFAARSR